MPEKRSQRLLDTSAIVVGYAMSRFDRRYLQKFGHKSWKAAFSHAAQCLDVAPASLKNLRDEFDPVHGNERRGWRNRPLRASRQRVLAELCEVSDDGLHELVSRILKREPDVLAEAIAPLAQPQRRIHNVAERLLTGRLAETYFLGNCSELVGAERPSILDRRQDACGFDFGLAGDARVAIEVKGLKTPRGSILFTDREWQEAEIRQDHYWLVVVGNLQARPVACVIRHPRASLSAKCRYQQTISAQWIASVVVTQPSSS